MKYLKFYLRLRVNTPSSPLVMMKTTSIDLVIYSAFHAGIPVIGDGGLADGDGTTHCPVRTVISRKVFFGLEK
jgi:hypothetical protein